MRSPLKRTRPITVRSPEWYEARRTGVTSTDIAAILGVSPYSSEGDIARGKLYGEEEPTDPGTVRRLRVGRAVEAVIRAEDEAEHGIRLRAVRRLVIHPTIPWAMTSLDFERVGEKTIVEAKSSRSRDWDDGLPDHVEVQVRWQMGVAGYPRAHIAVLRFGSDLACFDVDHDPSVFEGLIAIAEDFRTRLAAGGPFSESRDSIGRAYPFDSGATMLADQELEHLVAQFEAARQTRQLAEAREEDRKLAIKSRMGEAALLVGRGWRITWRTSKPGKRTDWEHVAGDYRRLIDARLPEANEEADFIHDAHTIDVPGHRPLILRRSKETPE